MKLIGLTGTIASGKSTVAEILSKLSSVAVIYTDELAREAVAPGTPALKSIIDNFGDKYLLPDGTLDRRALGNIIFNSSEAKKLLESITHPYIIDLMVSKISSLSFNDFVIIENAIMFESGQHNMMDGIIIVDVEPTTQKIRLMKRNNLTEIEAAQRIAAQVPSIEKIALAAEAAKPMVVIYNNFEDKQELFNEVLRSWNILIKKLCS